ncbi:MAG: IclR family transcriptional regulator [Pseudomonadota bacterium]
MVQRGKDDPAAGSSSLRVLDVLEQVVKAQRAVTLEEVTASSGLPKPTVFRILALLGNSGFLQRNPLTKRYSVGARLAGLALATMVGMPEHAQRRAILQRLVDEIGETINFTMLDGATVVYVDRVETPAPIRLHMEVGSHVPLHCTASGKLFLSFMDHDQRRRVLGRSRLPRLTERTVTDPAALEQQLKRIRAQGYSADVGEFMEGSIGFAVPVLDREGRIIATVTIHGPSPRMTIEKGRKHLPLLRRAARAVADTFALDQAPAAHRGASIRKGGKSRYERSAG